MRKFNIQLFADAAKPERIKGKKIIYLFRLLEEAKSENAVAMAFVTENERSKSKDYETTATKDGVIQTPGEVEQEITATTFLSTDGLAEKFEDAMDGDKKFEIWEVNLDSPVTGENNAGKFNGRYFQGYLKELSLTSSAEEYAEYETTFGIEGNGVRGAVTVTEEQQALADYMFTDTTPVTGA